MSASIESLHDKARRAIESGEHKFREAAEYLFKAKELGASQRETARAIGKSHAWVYQLLKWRDRGYRDSPFGPQSKKKRAAAAKAPSRSLATPEHAQAQTARAEAQKAKAELQTARALAYANMFPPLTKRIPTRERVALIKALQMLGSGRASERASAALIVENQRARLNLSWNDLLVPAEAENEQSVAA